MVTVMILANVEPGTPPDEWPWVYTVVAPDGDLLYTSGPPNGGDGFEGFVALADFVEGMEVAA